MLKISQFIKLPLKTSRALFMLKIFQFLKLPMNTGRAFLKISIILKLLVNTHKDIFAKLFLSLIYQQRYFLKLQFILQKYRFFCQTCISINNINFLLLSFIVLDIVFHFFLDILCAFCQFSRFLGTFFDILACYLEDTGGDFGGWLLLLLPSHDNFYLVTVIIIVIFLCYDYCYNCHWRCHCRCC